MRPPPNNILQRPAGRCGTRYQFLLLLLSTQLLEGAHNACRAWETPLALPGLHAAAAGQCCVPSAGIPTQQPQAPRAAHSVFTAWGKLAAWARTLEDWYLRQPRPAAASQSQRGPRAAAGGRSDSAASKCQERARQEAGWHSLDVHVGGQDDEDEGENLRLRVSVLEEAAHRPRERPTAPSEGPAHRPGRLWRLRQSCFC